MEKIIATEEWNPLAEVRTYHASAKYDGRWWAVRIHDLPQGYVGVTQGRTWCEAEQMAKDVIVMLLEVEPDTFNVELKLAEDSAKESVARFKNARIEAERAREIKEEALVRAARELTSRGVTVRDAGAILGVPYQTISKVAPKEARGDDR